MRPAARLAVSLTALVSPLVARSGTAQAQNADSFYFSNEAALTAGAMVAVPGDEGSVWYNPAGLGSLRRTRLNANGSVFGVRSRRVPRGLTSSFGGLSSSVDYGGADFIAVPTTASMSFSLLPNLTVSGGAFHTTHDVRSAAGFERVSDGTRTLTQKVNTLTNARTMHMGGAYGFDAGHGIRVGGGMFLVYSVAEASIDYLVGLEGQADKPKVISLSVEGSSTSWGLQPTQGLQWDVTNRLRLGAMFRFPELKIHSSERSSAAAVAGDEAGTSFDVEDQSGASHRTRWIDPARAFLGVAYDVSDIVRVAIDGDVSFALGEDKWGNAHRAIARIRGGVMVKATEAFHFGLGAFTDPASQRRVPEGLGSLRADYYGGTIGAILRTHLGARRPDAPVLTFCTAVRYAIGTGTASTASIAEDVTTQATRDVVVHDVMPYIGSSVAF